MILLFDCDGVVLDSNRLKTEAFRTLARSYGSVIADQFVEYHLNNGGVTRRHKFDYLFTNLLKRPPNTGERDALEAQFGRLASDGLRHCREVPGVRQVLEGAGHAGSTASIVSGGSAPEIEITLAERGLRQFFARVFGGETTKATAIATAINSSDPKDALFFGDSRLDYEAASAVGVPFVYVAGYSDWSDATAVLPGHVQRITDFTDPALHALLPRPCTCHLPPRPAD